MEGIDASSLFVFEGSGDSDDQEDYEDDDIRPLVAICVDNNAEALLDDAESSSSMITQGFDDDMVDDESDDGDDELLRHSIDDQSGSRLRWFVGRDLDEEEGEVNSGGGPGVGGDGRKKKTMDEMANKLFWETCLERGYP